MYRDGGICARYLLTAISNVSAGRSSIEAARISHRAWRDRVGAPRASLRQRRRRCRSRRWPGNAAAGRILVAPRSGAEAGTSESRGLSLTKVPDYMVPSVFVTLDDLPLTLTARWIIDALPAPAMERPEIQQPYLRRGIASRPCSPTSGDRFSGLPRSASTTTSSSSAAIRCCATQVMSRVREALGIELPLRVLFDAPTVAALADCANGASRRQPGAARTSDEGARVFDGRIPEACRYRRCRTTLVRAAAALVSLDRLEPGQRPLNIPLGAAAPGTRRRARRLERTLNEIVGSRALRVTFVTGPTGIRGRRSAHLAQLVLR